MVHPRSLEQPGFYRSRSNSSDLEHRDVEKTVYYFANSLEDITRPEDYSFFSDEARAIMIFKWMRFYCYNPGLSKGVDKPRRDELKDHLNLPFGFGQRLGSFIINKFNTFKKWGLIYENAVDHGIKYHALTNTWLSRTWDGNVEQSRLSLSRETRSPGSARILQKRPAPSPTPERDKRQRSATILDPNALRSSCTLSDNPSVMRASSLSTESSRPSVALHESDANEDIDIDRIQNNLPPERLQDDGVFPLRSTAFRHFIQRVYSASAPGVSTISTNSTTNTNFDSSDAIRAVQKSQIPQDFSMSRSSHRFNLVPDSRVLAARLEELAANTAASGNRSESQATASALPARFQGDLGTLKQKEKICRDELKDNIQQLEVARDSYKKLLKEYESLKSKLQAYLQVLDKACRHSDAVVPPTPAGISDADFFDRLEEVRQKRDDIWLESEKTEKGELEKKIAAQSRAKACKKIVVMEQKARLKELQARIRDIQEERVKDQKLKAKVEDVLSEFMDIEDESSGTVSPAESIVSDALSIDWDEIEIAE
jgi:hypothetical protein